MRKLFIASALLACMASAQVYPSAVATDANLPRLANSASTVLSGSLNNSATTFNVSSGTTFVGNMVLTIDSERIFCTTKSTNTFSGCTRGYDGSSAASHSSGTRVYGYIVAANVNKALDEIKSIESTLGANGSNIPSLAGLNKFSCTSSPVTCTFYDNTATTGRSIFSIRNGASQTWRPFEILNNGGTVIAGVEPDGSINTYTSGARSQTLYQNTSTLGVSGKYCFSNNADIDAGSADTCLVRNSAGKLEVQNGSGSTRDLKVRAIEAGNGTDPTVATLTCGTAPDPPASDKVSLYCEGDRLKAKNDAGTVYGIGSRALSFTFGDPAGSALSSGSTTTVYLTVPFACTINAWSIVVDAGTATVKFWRKATGTAIPTSSDSINTSGVAISTGTAVRSTTVSDFTSTSIAANDILAANITAVSTAKYLNAVLECN